MLTDWQTFIYPLGFLSSMFFGLRIVYQWFLAEKAGKSFVSKGFWVLSICGNSTHFFHSLFQQNLPLTLIQTLHLAIAFRNLNLLKDKAYHITRQTLFKRTLLAIATTLFFYCSFCFCTDSWFWMRVPKAPWSQETAPVVSLFWQSLGLTGMVLFASRFWLQWYLAEKAEQSVVGRSFWALSFIGASFALTYYLYVQDPVNMIGPLLGVVPYLRNWIFLPQEHKEEALYG